ncbi:Bug family tripartite tricarboxylate transporter substrate binding protein [Roseococcus pinisoli]|uniref:Tripartite tricarboxylate transporter substrate binding protein n=1 Tax=Roseococcus pinisoli TaxID=2835040 RepID=A0ABS5Q9Z9_9PROT|nr:tripartite tricarboxylate transporter substrate binding protein [Roseococcus pinisoli]MBS7810354.1 tripartite tricarboxylate transporter substrate binding protein [Roseococcus pinisoli]
MSNPLPAMSRRSILTGSAAVLATPVLAQAPWPNRPVRMVVPWPAGGAADLTGRIYANALSQKTGQPFVVENRGGATGTIGEQAVIQAPADGYTIMNESTPISITPALMPDLRFSPLREFQPVFKTMSVPQLAMVHPSVPARTLPELIALLRTANGNFAAGSSGIGSMQHLVLELFTRGAGVQVNHVPYRGGGPAMSDLLAGSIKLYFGNVNSSVAHVRAGSVRALAHTAGTPRINALPDLPAMSETLPGFETAEWNGIFVRTGTPPEIVQRLSALLNEIVAEADIQQTLRNGDLTAEPNTPAQFDTFFRGETARWARFIAEANIRLE